MQPRFATAKVSGSTVTIGTMGMSMMACDDDLMKWESALTAFLQGNSPTPRTATISR
jgi:heat shock protein HslJ